MATKSFTVFLLISSLLLAPLILTISEAHDHDDDCDDPPLPPIVSGLSWTFYKDSCPKLEKIVRKHLKKVFKNNIGLAAGLLRLHFHDCFVQGCDASVLLDGSASGPSEQGAIPNLSLRPLAFQTINDLNDLIFEKCGRVVSCADIVTLAARDSIHLAGGPKYPVPLGRRDGTTFATINATLQNLPSPFGNTSATLAAFATKNLNATDTVALSGGHTIGLGHCGSFANRLFPTQDPTMDPALANNLTLICPTPTTNATTVLDLRSPNKFDNKYYVDLVNRQGLFTSDQDLFIDNRTSGIVTSFANNKNLFFKKFASAMIRMGQLGVLTGNAGELRANCSAMNANNVPYLMTVVEEQPAAEDALAVF